MGDHYLLNLYGCSFNSLNNEEYLKDLIETAALCSGATILQIIGKSFQPQGVTILGLLAESHISIHTWPEKGEAAVDIFTCGDCLPKIGCDIIIEQIQCNRHTLQLIKR